MVVGGGLQHQFFFHQFANGRRRKNSIISLETDAGVISSQDEIMEHVTAFYKNLFGSSAPSNLKLSNSFWAARWGLSQKELSDLIRPFSEEKVKIAFSDMKSNSAPGPNGFGV